MQMLTVLCSAQAVGSWAAQARSQACRLHHVIALVRSQTPQCASEHRVSVITGGQDRNLDFLQGNKSIFSP